MLRLNPFTVTDALSKSTYVVVPCELRGRRIGFYVTVEVHVVAFFDAVRIDRVAETQRNYWSDCNTHIIRTRYECTCKARARPREREIYHADKRDNWPVVSVRRVNTYTHTHSDTHFIRYFTYFIRVQ